MIILFAIIIVSSFTIPLVRGHRLERDGIQRFVQVADKDTAAKWRQLIRGEKTQ